MKKFRSILKNKKLKELIGAVRVMNIKLSYHPVGHKDGFSRLKRYLKIAEPVHALLVKVLEMNLILNERDQKFILGMKDLFEIKEINEQEEDLYQKDFGLFVETKKQHLSKILRELRKK